MNRGGEQEERSVRYRRLSYRYAVVVHSAEPWALGDPWQSERVRLLGRGRWRPDVDTYETATAVEILVDLAGVEEEDFEVQLFEDADRYDDVVFLELGQTRAVMKYDVRIQNEGLPHHTTTSHPHSLRGFLDSCIWRRWSPTQARFVAIR